MKSPLKERIFWPLLTTALAAVLITLGTLQYRWSKEVSDATTTRLRASLNSSMLAFRQDFERELSNITSAFQADPRASSDPNDYAGQFRDWKKTASHPGLVKAVYLAEERSPRQLRLQRLNKTDSGFETTSWPTELGALEEMLPRFSIHKPGFPPPSRVQGQQVSGSTGWAGRDEGVFVSAGDGPSGVSIVTAFPPPGEPDHARDRGFVAFEGPGAPDHHGGSAEHARNGRQAPLNRNQPPERSANSGRVDRGWPPRGFPRSPWFIDASVSALICPINFFQDRGPEEQTSRWIIVELNQDFLRQHLLPELATRYFSGNDGLGYDVAVISDKDGQDVFLSGKPLAVKDADANVNLFGLSGPARSMDAASLQFHTEHQAMVPGNREFNIGFVARNHDSNSATPPLMLVSTATGADNWQLVVKNRQGSLEAAVSNLRHRQLALSFGILLVLAGTMAILVVASRRAHVLARLQMDFVTGVSHELRTPLAVISSAAENIADGVVENRAQILRYGNVIKNQSAQLKQLVEHILLFAATRHGRQRYTLRSADPASVIDVALENTGELIRNAEITLEKNIQPNLPPILIDVNALAHCLQNLITNAVKYGGSARWIGVSAMPRENARGTEVAITVSDRGMGIETDEIEQVFDPFFRGAAVREAQIHGSGLGLPLAKSIVEAMDGSITVESTPGSGSSFTVHIPVSEVVATVSQVRVARAVNPKRLIQNHE